MTGRNGGAAPRWCALSLILLALTFPCSARAQTMDPVHRFRTIRTPHFAIHFHQDEEHLAPRLAAIAEETWNNFALRPGSPPPPLTDVVLVDQTELPNGYATPLPRNTIVIYASAPGGSGFLHAPDWLEGVFVHEFTHIVQLDQSGGWARAARAVFGRAPWAFPNLLLPGWQVEGLATHEESRNAGSGRLHAGDFTAIVREAARGSRLEPLDRVNGGLTDWPGGHAVYAYGLGFHEYLAQRFGVESFSALSAATAGSLPWLGTRAFRSVYGASLGTLWRDYEAHLLRENAATANTPGPPARRLTRHGHTVLGPRYLPADCETCPIQIAYSVRTLDNLPGLHRLRLDTLDTERLATRYLGSTTGPGRNVVYFDQQEFRRNVGLYSDLYALDTVTGTIDRLTRDARLQDPDLSRDGTRIAAVQSHVGRRDLVVIDVTNPSAGTHDLSPNITTVLSDTDTQYNAPRWSPDGAEIAVERRRRGHPSDIIVVHVATRELRHVFSEPGVRWMTPAWRPDGQALVAAAARGDAPFNLYELSIEDARITQLTDLTGGATWPDVAPDGRTIVYVGYHADGFDLYEMPYPSASALSPPMKRIDATTPLPPAPAETPRGDVDSSAYRPWRTVLPTSWSPLIEINDDEVRAGAAISGTDVLGYHAWATSVSWPVYTDNIQRPNGNVPDWNAAYVYRRWQPQVWAALSRETTYFAGQPTASGLATEVTRVERATETGVRLPIRRVRFSHALQLSFTRTVATFSQAGASSTRNRSAARVSWAFNSAKQFGYSISPEEGVTFGAATELVRPAFGASASATSVTMDMRTYLQGIAPHHVVAIRLAGGTTRGDSRVGRVFLLGGGTANAAAGSLSSDAFSLLRGFAVNTYAGTRIGLLNVDYRWPIARPQRGLGTWPAFLHTVHAAVFADAGHAWSGPFRRTDVKTSLGAELSANIVLGYSLPLTASVGAAWGHDGSGVVADRAALYGRIGYAF